MADFSALKTAIQTYIKQNGNEEITGEILQEILLSVVTTLGDSAINNLVTALADEVAARQNADGTLQQNITNEATARGNADTTLSNRLGSTITAENTAAEQIGAEAEAREAADTALQGLIDGITDNIENGYVYAGIATPSSTPTTGKVFYLALTAGTYTNFGSTVVSQGINILKYNGSAWSLDAFIGIDDTPTPNSPKLVKSGGAFESVMANGSAFDISAYFASGGTLATYADLSAALNALDTLSASYKRGGMSIKYVQSSDNKYVQYRLMSDSFNITPTNWQGIDDAPTAGSENLVKSGGVAVKIDELRLETTGLVVSTALNTSVKNYYTQEIPVYAGEKYTGKLIANQSIGQSVLNFVFLLDNSNVKQENLNARDMSVAYSWEFTPVANGMLKFQYYLEGIQTEAVLSVIIEGELRKDIDKNTERIISAEDAISKINSDNAIFLGIDYTTSKRNYKFTYPIKVNQGEKISGVVKSNIPVGQSVFNIDFRDEDNTQIAYKFLNAQDLSTEISWESTVAVKDAIVYLDLYISGGVDSHIDMAILGNLGKTVRENKQSIDGIQLKDDILIDLSDKARFSVAGFDLTENTDGTFTLTNIGGFDGWQTIDFWGKEKYVSGKPYRLLLDLEVIKSSSRFAYFIAKSGNASSGMGFDLKTRKFYDIRILNTNGIDASEIFVQLSTKSTTSWNAGDIELKIYGFAVIDDMETTTEDLMSWCRFYGFDTVDKKKIANLSYMSYLAEHVKNNDSARVIDCWGDSLTEYGHPSYPQTLAALSGRMVNNYGDGGRTSQYIRELFLHGFEETHEKYGGSTAKQYDFPEHFNAEHTNIIWVGRNNVNLDEDWQSVIDDVKAMVDALGNSNYLVLMPPNGHYGTFGTDGTDGTGELKGGGVYEKFFMTLEERLSSIFGNHFFNVREAIIYGWSQNIKLLSSFTQPQIGSTVTIEVSDATSLTTYNADDVRVWGSEFMSKFVIGLNEEYDVYSVVSKLDDTHISATLVESNRVLPGNIVENIPCTDQNGDGVHFPKDLKVEQYADYMCRLYDTLPSSYRIDGIHHSDNGRLFVAKLIFDAINAIKI